MRRASWNFLVDLINFILFIVVTVSGVVLKYALPGAPGPTFWGMTRRPWGDIHWYSSVAFVIMVIVHIVLHWNWIRGYFKSVYGKKASEDEA